MYKNIFLLIFLLFSACSKPKPVVIPSWYTNPPVDKVYIYDTQSSDISFEAANKSAVVDIRQSLALHVEQTLKNNKILKIDEKQKSQILRHIVEISNRISMNRVKILKSKNINNKYIILSGIKKQTVYEKIAPILDVKLHRCIELSKKADSQKDIQKLLFLESAMNEYDKLISLLSYKEYLLDINLDDEYRFLSKLKKDYEKLKNSINIYVLSDINSKEFAKFLKDALSEDGLSVKNTLQYTRPFKLLITSKTQNSDVYEFKQSKTLLKLTLLDKNKNKVVFRQHTFIGKSKKSYKDAKKQAVEYMKYKMKKLGVFNFMGFKK
jgi:hypothetical protein